MVKALHDLADQIDKQVRLTSYPLAVKMLRDESGIPDGMTRPRKDLGYCLSTCQALAISRREGTPIAQLREDMWCIEPVLGYGLEEPPDYFLEGHNRFPKEVETLEAGARWAQNFPRLEAGNYAGIAFSPLRKANFEPDVVIIYCNSAQLTVLLLGIAYKDGSDVTSRLSGHASCVYSIVPALQTGKCQVAIPCMGDRTRAMAQNDEVIFAVPRGRVNDLTMGLRHILKHLDRGIPFGHTMMPEYELAESYVKIARMLGMKRANGKEIT